MRQGVDRSWSGFPRKQNQEGTDVNMDINYEELAPAFLEAERSHNVPPAGWRPREADGVSSSPKAGEDVRRGLGSSSEAGQKGDFLLRLPLFSSGHWPGRCPHTGAADRSTSLSPLIQMLMSGHALTGTSRTNVQSECPWPVKPTHKTSHHILPVGM